MVYVDAGMIRFPHFFISGQVNTLEDLSNFKSKPRQTGFQEMPVAKMFEDVTKKSLHVPELSQLEGVLKELLTNLKNSKVRSSAYGLAREPSNDYN